MKKLIPVIYLLMAPLALFAQNDFYVILAGATDASHIASGTKANLRFMKEFWQEVGEDLGKEVNFYELSGSQYTSDALLEMVDQVNEDAPEGSVVVLYNASHGFRYNDSQGNAPHIMVHPTLEYEASERDFRRFGVKVDDLYNRMLREDRLLLCMVEACNQAVDLKENPNRRDNIAMSFGAKAKRQLELLFNQTGGYISSSSVPGQLSWTNSEWGGFFTASFIRSFKEAVISDTPASFDRIFNNTHQKTLTTSREIQQHDSGVKDQQSWHRGETIGAGIKLKKQ